MARPNSTRSSGRGGSTAKANVDNRANQLNPNNSAYWQARGQGHETGEVTSDAIQDRHEQPNTKSGWR